ncbi:uncharacterized protein LOC142982505 [Anticarsia gemmatalis]|uniref:uncharacterized protein LOC142982505 n=1 Tax=Anticarsia gemmatalis TaxID=129554 RepID=UPI003F75BFC6
MDNRKTIGYIVIVNKNRNMKKKKEEKRKLEGINLGKYLRMKAGGTHVKEIVDLIGKSQEEVDKLAPGAIPYIDSSFEQSGPKITIPAYPFWNYWTYSKTVHVDKCAGDLVKVGDMCLQPSIHRRFYLR